MGLKKQDGEQKGKRTSDRVSASVRLELCYDALVRDAFRSGISLSGRHRMAIAVMVIIRPRKDSMVGISEKNSKPNIMAAVGSLLELRIETFPVST